MTTHLSRRGLSICNYFAPFFFFSNLFRLLGKVEVPLGELLGNNQIERTYDLVDGKNNPTLVSEKKSTYGNRIVGAVKKVKWKWKDISCHATVLSTFMSNAYKTICNANYKTGYFWLKKY